MGILGILGGMGVLGMMGIMGAMGIDDSLRKKSIRPKKADF